VAYDVMGHTFFTEDGVEYGHIIQGNLGFVTRVSHAILNTDTFPATFWLVHPNNTLSGNHAGGESAPCRWTPRLRAAALLSHPFE